MSNERQLERETELQDQLHSAELERIRGSIPKGIGPKFCECGEPIPDKRRLGGYHNCIECASIEEEHRKRFGR